ncbi:hypothetical protein WJ970_04365 [Achromobacter xylosoxidans]
MLFPSLKPILAGNTAIDLVWLALGSAPMAEFTAHARPASSCWTCSTACGSAARSRPPSPRPASAYPSSPAAPTTPTPPSRKRWTPARPRCWCR